MCLLEEKLPSLIISLAGIQMDLCILLFLKITEMQNLTELLKCEVWLFNKHKHVYETK